MEPTITLINTALSTAKILNGYGGYRRGKRKEDDAAIRKKLMIQLDELNQHLLNIMEDGDLDIRIAAKKVADVVDLFRNDIELAATGQNYPFFSIQRSVSVRILKSLITYDHQIIKALDKSVKTISDLELSLVKGDDESAITGLREVKGELTTTKGTFANRISIMKKVEKVQKEKRRWRLRS
jgi:hypothetical protein